MRISNRAIYICRITAIRISNRGAPKYRFRVFFLLAILPRKRDLILFFFFGTKGIRTNERLYNCRRACNKFSHAKNSAIRVKVSTSIHHPQRHRKIIGLSVRKIFVFQLLSCQIGAKNNWQGKNIASRRQKFLEICWLTFTKNNSSNLIRANEHCSRVTLFPIPPFSLPLIFFLKPFDYKFNDV